jgi:hypothetical protein
MYPTRVASYSNLHLFSLAVLNHTEPEFSDSYIKSTIAMTHLAEELKAAQLAREKRRRSRRRIFQSGGVLYAGQARAFAKKRDEDEVKKYQELFTRAEERELRKGKAPGQAVSN